MMYDYINRTSTWHSFTACSFSIDVCMQILSRDVPLMSECMTILISLNEKNVCSQVEGKNARKHSCADCRVKNQLNMIISLEYLYPSHIMFSQVLPSITYILLTITLLLCYIHLQPHRQ